MTLNDVKPGDEVIIQYAVGRIAPRPISVKRVTEKWIVTDNEQRFRKDGGWEVGKSAMDASIISPATPEKLAEIREREHRNNLARDIRQAEYSRLTTNQLERIYAILTETAAEEAAK